MISQDKRSILITGVSGGIGLALAKVFQQADFKVYGLDLKKPTSNDFIEFFSVDLNQFCNSSDYRGVISSLIHSKIEQLDVLINNAAIQILGHVEEIQFEDWQISMNVNLTAPFLLSQLFINKLEKSKGCIINVGSIHQQLTKTAFVSYATSKSALIGLTKALAVDLQNKVRVNAISPAAIETDMLIAGFDGNELAIDQLRNLHPVKKIGSPEDVARMALFLANENTGFIHGANFTMDGGISSVLKDL